MANFTSITPPATGTAITRRNGQLVVPDDPIIPFIEGDGTGRDIWKASQLVFDAAVKAAYGGRRRIVWYEIFAGEKAFQRFNDWLPQGTLDAIRHFRDGDANPLKYIQFEALGQAILQAGGPKRGSGCRAAPPFGTATRPQNARGCRPHLAST